MLIVRGRIKLSQNSPLSLKVSFWNVFDFQVVFLPYTTQENLTMAKKAITDFERSEFTASVLQIFMTVPKSFCYTRDFLNTEGGSQAQCLTEAESGRCEIHLTTGSFSSLSQCLSTITHEAMHAALADILYTLEVANTLNTETTNLITERASYVCQDLVFNIVENFKQIEKDFRKVKINEQ